MEENYKALLIEALNQGVFRADRTKVGSNSIFSKSFEFDLSKGLFPLITGKKMFFKNVISEFNWFINGETNIARFKKDGVSIWDAWADEQGELGPVYGYQMLNYNGEGVNQLRAVVKSLRENPDSRRHIITLWNPLQLSEMRLPPCYLYFQFFVAADGFLNMQVVQRSADLFIGVPYDIALFSLLLMHVSLLTGYTAGRVHVLFVDAHIYITHQEQVKQYLALPTFTLPSVIFNSQENIELINYESGPYIGAKVAI